MLSGWNTKADGTGTPFAFGTTTVTANLTIYAQWISLYTVTFNANGGTDGTITSVTVERGKTVPTTTTGLPTRTDYTFTAWNTKADGTGTPFAFGTTTVTANLTIYAQWTAIIPTTPTNLTATVDVTNVSLSWTASTNATYYEVYRNNVKANAANITSTTFTDEGLTEVTTYTYTVKACNSAACSPLSATITATTKALVFTVTNLKQSGDIRPNYVAFSISANGSLPNYVLALEKSSVAKPTATQMNNGYVYKRNLSTATMNLMLWADRSSNFQPTSSGATLISSILQPNTSYKLYGMKDGGADADVKELATFTTDAIPSSSTDRTLDKSIYSGTRPVFTLRRSERFVWLVNGVFSGGSEFLIDGLSFTLCQTGLCIPPYGVNYYYFMPSLGNGVESVILSRRTDFPSTDTGLNITFSHNEDADNRYIDFVFEK